MQEEIDSYNRSYELCPFYFDYEITQEEDSTIKKALQIIVELDVWLLDRIIEPYSSVDGENQVWLYCKGMWKSFRSSNNISSYSFMKEVILKAINQ